MKKVFFLSKTVDITINTRVLVISQSVGQKDCRSDSKYRPNIVSRRIVLRVRRYYRIADLGTAQENPTVWGGMIICVGKSVVG